MNKSYSYNPANIGEPGVDKMRFELGDTIVEDKGQTAMLCDEEIRAVIASTKTWKRAKLKLVESIMRGFSYEVDEKIGPLSLSLRERYENWEKMYNDLKKELENSSVPSGIVKTGALGGKPYFREGMHDNPESGPTIGGRRNA